MGRHLGHCDQGPYTEVSGLANAFKKERELTRLETGV
ncbi:hypothetical protein LPCP272_02130 [Lacticaseibacillus paracasei]|nr:hypothetical protein LPCP272_02130 [Lacticaseibacillus paracasei]